MVRTSALLIVILLVFAVSHRNCFGFKWPFLGNVTDEKLERRALCYTKICLKDADILIKAATLNDSVDPCMDFKSFALGEFHEYRHLNDRYTDIGFENDIYRNLYEKKRVVLKLKHRDHEPRVFTIMKQFFAKCRNSSEWKIIFMEFWKLIKILSLHSSHCRRWFTRHLATLWYVVACIKRLLVGERFLHKNLVRFRVGSNVSRVSAS